MSYRKHNGRFITKKEHEMLPRMLGTGFLIFAIFSAVYISSSELCDWVCELMKPVEYVAKIVHPTAEIVPEEATENAMTWKLWTLSDHNWTMFEQMYHVIKCESGFQNVQSRLHYKTGGREKSFGIVQLHLPAHKDITKAQALDPDFALNYIVKEFKAGRQAQWSCFIKLYK
jgi:hypothetical protein